MGKGFYLLRKECFGRRQKRNKIRRLPRGLKGNEENLDLGVRVDNEDFRLGQALGAPLVAD
jgi:hypothetical protein